MSKDIRGTEMPPSEVASRYRLYSAYCVEIAERVSDQAHKVALLNMAQGWARLAELVEKSGKFSAQAPTIGAERSP